nr:hypothetical protein CDL12_30573 [Ipomoea trifida]GMC54224.1 hypothetical protein CDL12_30573 [Ipomoea batatas]
MDSEVAVESNDILAISDTAASRTAAESLVISSTSRSSWTGNPEESETRLRLRVREPVNMDQKASRRIATITQSLYFPLPKKPWPPSELCSFFPAEVITCASSSFISSYRGFAV